MAKVRSRAVSKHVAPRGEPPVVDGDIRNVPDEPYDALLETLAALGNATMLASQLLTMLTLRDPFNSGAPLNNAKLLEWRLLSAVKQAGVIQKYIEKGTRARQRQEARKA